MWLRIASCSYIPTICGILFVSESFVGCELQGKSALNPPCVFWLRHVTPLWFVTVQDNMPTPDAMK